MCNEPSECVIYRAFSANDHDLGFLRKALSEELSTLHTCPHNGRTTRPISWSRILLEELDIPKAMRVDDQGFVPGAPTHEIMTCIADDQSQVSLARKIDTGFDVLLCSSLDYIDSVEALRACGVCVIGRQARVVGIQRPKGSTTQVEHGQQLLRER
jgi:hypothetical protein